MTYTGMNFSHGGLYALVVHIVVYFMFLPNELKINLTAFRGCSAGAMFLIIKLSKETKCIPEKYFKTSPQALDKILSANWHNLPVLDRALLYKRYLTSLTRLLPKEFKKLTLADISEQTNQTEYTIPVTKFRLYYPFKERVSFSSRETPHVSFWTAASSSANPLCFHHDDFYLCDGAYDYDIFGFFGQVLHVTTHQSAKEKLVDYIYVPKGFKTVQEILTHLQTVYEIVNSRVKKK
jgi:hypothetical protein